MRYMVFHGFKDSPSCTDATVLMVETEGDNERAAQMILAQSDEIAWAFAESSEALRAMADDLDNDDTEADFTDDDQRQAAEG